MQSLRRVLVILLLAYVAWVAWPGVKALIEAPTTPPSLTGVDHRVNGKSFFEALTSPSPQGEAAAAAVMQGDMPILALWGGVCLLYLIAAFLFATANSRAGGAYFAALAGDVVLTILGRSGEGSGFAETVLYALAYWDTRYYLIAGAIVAAVILMVTGRRASGSPA